MPQTEGTAAPKSRSRETKRGTALKTALAHAEAELQHPDLMFLGEPLGGRAPVLISARAPACDTAWQPSAGIRSLASRPPWQCKSSAFDCC